MTQASQRPSFDDLDAVMRRSPAAPRFTQQKLEPVVLPPPPTHVDPPALALASPEDDIEPDREAEYRRRRTLRLVLSLTGCAIVAAAAGYLAWSRMQVLTGTAPPPAIETAPPVVAPSQPPSSAAAPEAVAPTPPPRTALDPPAADAAARVEALRNANQSELTPPATDGLTPARRVPTQRIIVDNDREVSP